MSGGKWKNQKPIDQDTKYRVNYDAMVPQSTHQGVWNDNYTGDPANLSGLIRVSGVPSSISTEELLNMFQRVRPMTLVGAWYDPLQENDTTAIFLCQDGHDAIAVTGIMNGQVLETNTIQASKECSVEVEGIDYKQR